jgi:pimeloyl-ACP methyl ester carboxylesterase
MKASRIGTKRSIIGLVAGLLILGSWLGAGSMKRGLVNQSFVQGGVPLTFLAPEGEQDLPGVIVAHGFAGSQQIMLGYGLAFARAGYAAMLLDFSGHASNPNPLSTEGDALQSDLDRAYQALIDRPEVNPDEIALLGHSMGSGAVMQAGIEHPERYAAVIAISPTSAEVTESAPPNLLLQAGEWEGRFIENAKGLLEDAGGPNDDFDAGLARQLVVIPNVEHITILFSPESRDAAVEWLSDAFDTQSELDYKDRRMVWYGLHLLGWLLAASTIGPLGARKSDPIPTQPGALRRWFGLLLIPFVATSILILLAGWLDLTETLGFLVGGALAIWLFIGGILWLTASVSFHLPVWKNLLWGGVLFALIWVAMGLMGQFTWIQWVLIPSRLWRWPILALACLPWMLALGHTIHHTDGWRRAGLWLVHSAVMVSAMLLLAFWTPDMFVVALIAPLLPIILGVEFLISRAVRDPWVFAVGNALFFGWMIAAIFPIV